MILPVQTPTGNYDIVMRDGALHSIGSYLDLDRRVLVVTDSGVPEIYSDTAAKACKVSVRVCIPQGEASKSPERFLSLLSVMLHEGFTRGDCVLAVGGGVVGDLSGFAASCYMRGIDFYNVPTTLLSQIDSSVGGKTAIDLDGVKNVVGAFYPPKRVVIDPLVLDTLEDRQLRAGLAEAIKMAACMDEELFCLLESSTDFARDRERIIRRCLELKKDVVEQDPNEKGLRRVLNFGHTVGHGIEAYAKGNLLHGECVAMGMLPMCAPDVRVRLKKLLNRYHLCTDIPCGAEELMPFILHDKKKTSGGISAVLVDRIGQYRFETLTAQDIAARMEENL